MEEVCHGKRPRADSNEFEFESANAKKIREQLLSLLDDLDTVPDHDLVSLTHDLESLIRSFEEEISGSKCSSDLESGTSELLPEVGELNRIGTGLEGIVELWDFQDDLLNYDPFRFELDNNADSVADVTGEDGDPENRKEYVTLDGIFDYLDENFGSDFSWRYETFPAF